ncbi:hypothetical protein AB0I28_22135 [Phytomonospora sp. NPDC050363]|uniref:hypothetical protein n=1 Tax=Phytomonospora sp. NPDC050363 TaxID=3155642 RepID=UPI0034001A42
MPGFPGGGPGGAPPGGVPGGPFSGGPPPKKLSTGAVVAIIAAAVVILLCLVCGILGVIRANDDRATGGLAVVPTPGLPTAPKPPAVAPKSLVPPKTDRPATAFAGEGTYLVGTDITPGQFRALVPETAILCYWERLSGTSGEFGDIIANGEAQPGAPEIVTIAHSDKAFRTRGCGSWSLIA